MTLAVFLNVVGLCLGFVSAIFFAIGALTMTPAKIQKVAATSWDANQHWGDSTQFFFGTQLRNQQNLKCGESKRR